MCTALCQCCYRRKRHVAYEMSQQTLLCIYHQDNDSDAPGQSSPAAPGSLTQPKASMSMSVCWVALAKMQVAKRPERLVLCPATAAANTYQVASYASP